MPRPSPRSLRPVFGLFVLLASASLIACRTPTSITVEITTDVACADLKGVTIASGDPAKLDSLAPVATTTRCAADGASKNRVGSLVIVPSGATDAQVGVRVVAGVEKPVAECTAKDNWAGCIVVRRVLGFEPRTELTLPIELHRVCKSLGCDQNSTCVRGGFCASSKLTNPGDCNGEGCLGSTDVDAGTDASPPGDAAGDGSSDAPKSCTTGEKSCDGKCVAVTDPAYGCGDATCSPCNTPPNGKFTCEAGACKQVGCAAGFKDCGGTCVAADADHGCDAAACTPCDATNGVASCAAGACKLACNTGYKLCGGKCVNIGDPTFGCGATTCDASTCPPAGGGTVICSGGACVVGACGVGTKACGGKCVPTDVTNGCADVTRCTACATGETCVGGPPTTCQCVPESKAVTCSKVDCGTVKNNCGQTVDCGTTKCLAPQSCGGGGVANMCGCTPLKHICDGSSCGTFTDSCGNPYSCGCIKPFSCGGGGVLGQCGCTPTDPCGGGANCGTFSNGCLGNVTCTCASPKTCGGGGVAGKCGCPPFDPAAACLEAGQVCGKIPDNCGGTVSCGTCTAPGYTRCCIDYCGRDTQACVYL